MVEILLEQLPPYADDGAHVHIHQGNNIVSEITMEPYEEYMHVSPLMTISGDMGNTFATTYGESHTSPAGRRMLRR